MVHRVATPVLAEPSASTSNRSSRRLQPSAAPLPPIVFPTTSQSPTFAINRTVPRIDRSAHPTQEAFGALWFNRAVTDRRSSPSGASYWPPSPQVLAASPCQALQPARCLRATEPSIRGDCSTHGSTEGRLVDGHYAPFGSGHLAPFGSGRWHAPLDALLCTREREPRVHTSYTGRCLDEPVVHQEVISMVRRVVSVVKAQQYHRSGQPRDQPGLSSIVRLIC